MISWPVTQPTREAEDISPLALLVISSFPYRENGSAHRSSDPYVDVFEDLDDDVDDVQGVATDELGQAGDDDITDIVVSRRLFLLFGNDDLSWLLGSNYRLFRHVLASTNALQRQQKNVMSLFFTILFCSDLCVDSPGS